MVGDGSGGRWELWYVGVVLGVTGGGRCDWW